MERLHTDVQAGSQKTRKGQLRHCEGGHRGKPAPAVGLGVEGREGAQNSETVARLCCWTRGLGGEAHSPPATQRGETQ